MNLSARQLIVHVNRRPCRSFGQSHCYALRRTRLFGALSCSGSKADNLPHCCELVTKMKQSAARYSTSTKSLTATTTTIAVTATPFDRSTVKGPHGSYLEEYHASINDPVAFWAQKAQAIHWFQPPQTILQYHPDRPLLYRWFPDGLTNTCYNCLDVHVQQGRGEQVALYYDSPVTNSKKRYTYQEMLDHVAALAGGLVDLGVQPGDVVLIYMPMIPEAVMAMLACARIGATHSVVFGGFAAKELAKRIRDCHPKVIVSASAGVEPSRIVSYQPLLEAALALVPHHTVETTIMVQRSNVQECQLGPREVDYQELMAKSSPVPAVPVRGDHTHYLLYTSGTTGVPKGVVRDTAGWAVALKYTMTSFFDMNPGDTMFTGSDIGWVVGHSYIVYAPLLHGCATVLYEGKPVGTPDAGAYWRIIEEYDVKTLFVAPTAFRAIKQADPHGELIHNYDLRSFRALFLAGEHSDPATLQYCQHLLSKYGAAKDAIDHWWQTELGHPAVGNAIGLGRMPLRPGACSAPAPGFDVRIVDDDGKLVEASNELGNMVIRTPLPPGALPTLYNNDDGFIQSYLTKYPGFYDTGDAAFIDQDGYIHIMGRTDDLINTSGYRISTGGLEEVLQSHPEVAECAVVPMKDPLKGMVPIGFVILNRDSTEDEEQLKAELVAMVRESIGAIASFRKIAIVKALPKTRSGKILRGTMSKIANGQEYTVTPTVEDPNIFTYLEPIVKELARSG